MQVNVIKTAQDGTITKETVEVKGVAKSELTIAENWREFDGILVDRTEKALKMKDGKELSQYIYNDEQDSRGTQLNLETFSPTDDGILSQLMEDKKKNIHLYYEIHTDNYGTKFRIKAIELPDGTWTAPKAKEAWKKGNAVNNRALAVQSASALFMGSCVADGKEQNEAVVAEVLAIADKLYEWIKSE